MIISNKLHVLQTLGDSSARPKRLQFVAWRATESIHYMYISLYTFLILENLNLTGKLLYLQKLKLPPSFFSAKLDFSSFMKAKTYNAAYFCLDELRRRRNPVFCSCSLFS